MTSRLCELAEDAWRLGRAVQLPLDGFGPAWALSGLTGGLVLVPHAADARRLKGDLAVLGQPAAFLPEPPLDAQNLRGDGVWLERGSVWNRWLEDEGILIVTPGGLCTPMRSPDGAMTITLGQEVGRDHLVRWLIGQGYRRQSMVWERGDMAVRGAVVDFYDPSAQWPVRVEFFDDDVEAMRLFAPKSQRSFETVSQAVVNSARSQVGSARLPAIPDGRRCVLLSPKDLENRASSFVSLWNQLGLGGELTDETWNDVVLALGRKPHVRLVKEPPADVVLKLSEPPFFRGDWAQARSWCSVMESSGFSIHVASSSVTRPESLCGAAQLVGSVSPSSGIVDSALHDVWLSDCELFGVSDSSRERADGELPDELQNKLSPGQWLIHERYGVCQFLETGREKFGTQSYETLVLGFADGKRLIIPFSDLYKLTIWDGDGEPQADKLGSKRWSGAREKAEAQIEQEAQELLTLYATRAITPGRAFAPNGEMRSLFDQSFPYRETRDQLKAIREIDSDMERPFPMDRLLVGDVGYGKTEVALRAAVKAVENGLQAAFVAPTTVLAQQHYRTCLARIGDLPIRTALLSRMVTPAGQKKIRTGLAEGTIDLVVGTHSLFRTALEFKNLGLLILDEEHRFGVAHKESLKATHPGVDVLSLSATPIPRSLSMAWRGIKDISLLTTPPASRGRIYTVTGPWSESLVSDALARELQRGGQVYYLHNRIEDIQQVAWRVSQRFPDAPLAVAHGQMNQRELEDVMERFYRGAVQILICTTIVESGLDVARANTLVVDDVRWLGLAQMHQIRGRIGRRQEDGYAYFLYPGDDASLPGQTWERLEALGAMESSGGGYRLAQRDLEIRGAGEILGTSQHGFKQRIGYSLYYRKLRERIAQLRGESQPPVEVAVLFPLDVPETYMPSVELRIGLYRRLAEGLSAEDRNRLTSDLTDRYGPLPPQVQGLLALALVRREGRRAGLESLKAMDSHCWAKTVSGVSSVPRRWVAKGGAMAGPGGPAGLADLADWVERRTTELESEQR